MPKNHIPKQSASTEQFKGNEFWFRRISLEFLWPVKGKEFMGMKLIQGRPALVSPGVIPDPHSGEHKKSKNLKESKSKNPRNLKNLKI